MPWFKNKPSIDYTRPAFLDRPNDPASYSGEVRQILQTVPQLVKERFEKEASILSSLGLPIPIQRTQLRFEPVVKRTEYIPYYLQEVRVHTPTFDVPNYRSFQVRYHRHYVVTEASLGFEADLDSVVTNFEQSGLATLIGRCDGVWTSRDPYLFYKITNKHGSVFHGLFKEKYPDYTDPLEQLPDLRKDEIEDIEHRIKFFQRVANYEYPFGRDVIKYKYHEPIVYELNNSDPGRSIYLDCMDEDLLFHAKLPQPRFQEGALRSYKIIPSQDVAPAVIEQWFDTLRDLESVACFEVRNVPEHLYFQITVSREDAPLIERTIELYFPSFTLLAIDLEEDITELVSVTARPTYAHAFLKERSDFALDPYLALFSLFEHSSHTERLQLFFAPMQEEVFQKLLRAIPVFCTGEENRKSLVKKTPPWLLAITLYSDSAVRIKEFRQTFFRQYETSSQHWEFSDPDEVGYVDYAIPTWSIVTGSELASLIHFPGKEVKSERLETAAMKAKLPPDSYTIGNAVIGESEARGIKKRVTLPASARDHHLYIVGKSGMGKSTLLTNAVIANMQAGEGVCVIDPHGDLVASGSNPLLDYVPEDRIGDTIYFNAADKEYPLALNMLSAKQDDELSLLADNLLVVFRRQSESWGPRMEDILRATLQTLMHVPGTTFLDIKRLLHNEAFRRSIVRRLTHPMLKEFWEEDFPTNYSHKDASAPIISRVNKFLYLPQLYTMLSSPESKIDFYDVIQSNEILLVNLSSGTIGEDNAQLLGSLIVTQLQMPAMRRAALPPSQRHPFYLYVDEFQNFTNASFEKILSEARKYNLCLTLAHQYISQLPDTQRDAIFGNVGSMIMFSCGDKDAGSLRYQLGSYEPQDLVNLKKFEALLRPESAQETFPFKTVPPPEKPEGFAEAIIEHTRMTYATIIDPDAAPQIDEGPSEEVAPAARITAKPIAALKKNFSSKGDELLYYIEQAEYLNTDQIKQLCYRHLVESARAAAASRDLKKLIDAKRLKKPEPFGKGVIYFVGRTPKPTSHNLEVRNLLVKILRSGFEIAEVTFCPQLPSLVPDLAVSFLGADGGQIKTFWEYDAGTEGIAELIKKVARYEFFKDEALITFVFNSRSRLEQVNRSIKEGFIRLAVLEEIGTLHDPVFQNANGGPPHPFF